MLFVETDPFLEIPYAKIRCATILWFGYYWGTYKSETSKNNGTTLPPVAMFTETGKHTQTEPLFCFSIIVSISGSSQRPETAIHFSISAFSPGSSAHK